MQFEDDGRGVLVRQLLGNNGEFLGAIVQHQATASIPADEIGKTRPNVRHLKTKSVALFSCTKKGDHITHSNFTIDGARQSLTGGPWIYYFSDQSEFKKIPISSEDSQSLKSDLDSMDLFQLVVKWCVEKRG